MFIWSTCNGAVSVSDGIAVCLEMASPFFSSMHAYTVKAHLVVLCVAAHEDHIITGGDDGRFLQISFDGKVKEIANFNSKWVDCTGKGWHNCLLFWFICLYLVQRSC